MSEIKMTNINDLDIKAEEKNIDIEIESENQKIDDELEKIGRRELKYLNRSQLLEILLDYAKENEKLRDDISNLEEKLNDKQIKIKNFGSIAEASIGLNEVFESAEAACAQYIANAKRICDEQMEKRASKLDAAEREAKEMLERAKAECADIEGEKARLLSDTLIECEKMKIDTQTQCEERIQSVERQCNKKIRLTEKQCREKELESEEKVKNDWDILSKRLEAFYESHNGLMELVNKGILNVPGRGKVNET